MALIDTVKKIAQQTENANTPATFMFGTVTALSPIAVRVDSRFDISGSAVIVSKEITELAIGSKVALLRSHGGQKFFILGRV